MFGHCLLQYHLQVASRLVSESIEGFCQSRFIDAELTRPLAKLLDRNVVSKEDI